MQKLFPLSNNLPKYLVGILLLVIPLYPKFPFITVPGTFVSIRLEDFMILCVAMLLFFSILPEIKKTFSDDIFIAVFTFLMTGLVSLISGIVITKTVVAHIGILHFIRRIEYFIPLFLGYYALKKSDGVVSFTIKLIMIVILTAFVYGYGQKHFSWPIVVTQNLEYSKGIALRWIPGSHINATFAGHYDLATFLVFTLPLVTLGIFLFKRLYLKILFSLTFFAGLWLLVNSASRISLASFMLSVTLSLILVRKYYAIPLVIIASLVFVNFSSNLIARYTRIFTLTLDRVQKINLDFSPKVVFAQEAAPNPFRRPIETPTPTPPPVFEDRSTSIRLNVEWPRAIRALLKNPLLGTGYSSITLATDNHYLRLLGEVGLAGFLSFFLIFYNIVIAALRKVRLEKVKSLEDKVFLAGIIGAFPGVLLNAFFIDIFEASKFAIVFWLVIGMFYALVKLKKYEQYN